MRNVTIVLLMVAVVGVWAAGADAAITETKDSANFNIKDFEGDSVPSAINGDMDGWSVDGLGNYVIVQDGDTGSAGKDGEFSYATGWTAEIRFKVTGAPTNQALQLILGDGHSGHYYAVYIAEDGVSDRKLNNMYAGDLTNAFHVLRVAQEGNGGEVKIYVDNVDTGKGMSGTPHTLNRQWFGDNTGYVVDGTVKVDYFRLDSTGGYAPIPEPATMILLGLGGIGVLIHRKRR